MTVLRIPPRKQNAIYFPPFANTTFGRQTEGVPVLVPCRWDDTQEESMAFDGSKFLSKSIIYPDRVLAVGGFLAQVRTLAYIVSTISNDYFTPTTTAFELNIPAEWYADVTPWDGGIVQFSGTAAGALAGTCTKLKGGADAPSLTGDGR